MWRVSLAGFVAGSLAGCHIIAGIDETKETIGDGGGSGGTCAEEPCKTVAPQCGCAPHQQCSVSQLTAGSPGERVCEPIGETEIGQPCGGPGTCKPGAYCGTPPSSQACEEFCDSDAMCDGPGGSCELVLQDGDGGTLAGVTICSLNCDPVSNAGCNAPNAGCQISKSVDGMKFFTHCFLSGVGMQGAACQSPQHCAPTFGCFTTTPPNGICLKYCTPAAQDCSSGTTCSAFNPNVFVGGQEYRACAPPP